MRLSRPRWGRGSERWPAGPAPVVTAFDPDTVDRTVNALVDARSNYDYSVVHRRIVGANASCLMATPTGPTAKPATLCLSAEGVPLVIETPTLSLRALRYSRHVDAGRFRLPAPA